MSRTNIQNRKQKKKRKVEKGGQTWRVNEYRQGWLALSFSTRHNVPGLEFCTDYHFKKKFQPRKTRLLRGLKESFFATVCTANYSEDNDMLSASAAEMHTPQPFTAKRFRDAIEAYCANRIPESTCAASSCDTYSCAIGWIFREGAMVSMAMAWFSLMVEKEASSIRNISGI